MKVRKAYYKAQYGNLTDMAISGWTGLFNPGTPAVSHVEIGFPVNGGWTYFSSSIRDGGTRWKTEAELMKHPERWIILERDWSEAEIDMKCVRAQSISHLPYDKLGIAGFVTLFGQLNDRDKWYCSEACFFVDWGVWRKRVSPRREYAYSLKRGYQKGVLM